MDDASLDEVALRVEGVSKAFGEVAVLSSLSLSVARGRTLALIGRSGSGKSTLLRCLNLTIPPDDGVLAVGGQTYFAEGGAIFEPWEIRRQVGLVLQGYPLFPNLTVRENLTLALRRNEKIGKSEALDRVEPVATTLGIHDLYEKYPATLSGGQAQRCALARALVLRPQVLLLDEITSALDPSTISDVIAAIRLIRAAPGARQMTLVIVTHLISFAESFADDIAFMHSGTIWELHEAATFRKRAARPETKLFLEGWQPQ